MTQDAAAEQVETCGVVLRYVAAGARAADANAYRCSGDEGHEGPHHARHTVSWT